MPDAAPANLAEMIGRVGAEALGRGRGELTAGGVVSASVHRASPAQNDPLASQHARPYWSAIPTRQNHSPFASRRGAGKRSPRTCCRPVVPWTKAGDELYSRM